MRFNRLALIERIDELQVEAERKHKAEFEPRKRAWDKAVEHYRAENSDPLASALRALANKAKAGKILHANDISSATNELVFTCPQDPGSRPGSYRSTIYSEPEPAPFTPSATLAALRALLVKLEDDTVSTRELQALGFSPAVFIEAAV